jgi:hypothetical protein
LRFYIFYLIGARLNDLKVVCYNKCRSISAPIGLINMNQDLIWRGHHKNIGDLIDIGIAKEISIPGVAHISMYQIEPAILDARLDRIFVEHSGELFLANIGCDYPNEYKFQESSMPEKIDKPRESIEDAGIWAGGPWKTEFYHWFANKLFRCYLGSIASSDATLVTDSTRIFAKESLSYLLPNYKIIKPSSDQMILVRKLLVSEDLPHYKHISNTFYLDWLTTNLGLLAADEKKSTNANEYDVLFISRRDTKRRQARNEEWLISYLQQNTRLNIRHTQMAGLGLLDQVRIARKAQALIGAHGAGMIFSMFQPKNSIVVEFFGNDYINYSTLPFAVFNEKLYNTVTTSCVVPEITSQHAISDLHFTEESAIIASNNLKHFFYNRIC